MKALVVENLSKNFDGLQALDNISFSVEKGERLAIIGPNGAGKTTLFQLINGIIPPSSGKIFLFGKDITKLSTYQRASLGIGRTFQITNLFSNLTVFDNVLLALEAFNFTRFNIFYPAYSYKKLVSKAEEILNEWNLLEKKDDLVKNLSYGEQRKLEIILTLSQNRSLLLLDEPTCGLSFDESKNFVSMIRSFSREYTILLIDHDLDVTFEIAEKVMVLHFGRIIAYGNPEEVRNNPKVQQIYTGEER
jgi:branched-chain amino acid transport system ATP-binding protein